MVDLNASNILQEGSKKIKDIGEKWRYIFQQKMNSHYCLLLDNDMYDVVFQKELVGLLMVVLVRSSLNGRVQGLSSDTVKCGLGNQLGNKGAICLRLKIDNTVICLVNSHLEAGQTKSKDRVNSVNDIHLRAFTHDKSVATIFNSHYRFLFGDMNFRLQLDNY